MFSSEKRYFRQAFANRKVLALVLLTMVLSAAGIATIAAQTIPSTGISPDAHQAIVAALKEQVSVLKWIGGGVVSAMATTVALLFRALQEANTTSRKDLAEGIRRRETLIEAVLTSNNTLQNTVGDLVNEYRLQRGAKNAG